MFELHPQLAKDCLVLGDLPLSQVLLSRDSRYPWLILVPRRLAIREIYELSRADQTQLLAESSAVSQMMMQLYRADKMNVAALGNMVAQLHIHHIARFTVDDAWPKPVWGQFAGKDYTEEALTKQVQLLQRELGQLALGFDVA